MNLAEAFKVAIPDIPIRTIKRDWIPCIDPNLIVREAVEDGKPLVNVLIPESRRYYPLPPEQWELLKLFDGRRRFAEVADLYSANTGVSLSETEVRQFAEVCRDIPFWYQTPQERNIALSEKIAEERRQKLDRQSPFSNLAEISFSAWDPDRYLGWLHSKVKFVFSPWFILLNLAMFAWSLFLWLSHGTQMGLDTVQFFDFSQKDLSGFAEFWGLMLIVGFVHESSHGLACKHTGGEVHRMGFLLIYLSPAFFCDVTEAWVFGGRWQRVMTMVAGLWSEMVLCFFATVVWWGTPEGTVMHRIAYEFILLAGIGAVIINLNPLIKLDGYYIFTEMIGISDLKENSTEFFNAWIKRHIFRLPVEVPYVRPRRAVLYFPYALLSEVYGYTLLFVVVVLVYHFLYRYTPEWAFLPALLLALLIFRSRIRGLFRLLKTVYLDKKVRMLTWSRRPAAFALAVLVIAFLFAPVWKRTVAARFILEPAQRDVVRTTVPGFVSQIRVSEGQQVSTGEVIAELQNLDLTSQAAKAKSEAVIAAQRSREAELHYSSFGQADQERKSAEVRSRLLAEQMGQLVVRAEIGGVVTTQHPQDRLGAFLPAGSLIAEIAEVSQLRARIYIPEYDLRDLSYAEPATLVTDADPKRLKTRVETILPSPVPDGDPMLPKQEFRGARVPRFFVAMAAVDNSGGALRPGQTGLARIFIRRWSIAGMIEETTRDFLKSKVW